MNVVPFAWTGNAPLAEELGTSVCRASVRTAAHGRPIALTLWRSNGSGLRIQSQMKDLAERTEVGVLAFDLVDAPFADEKMVDLPSAFSGVIEVFKLSIDESGTSAESGIELKTRSEAGLVVVAGASPYTIAIKGVIHAPHAFEPEYPEESYVVAPMK